MKQHITLEQLTKLDMSNEEIIDKFKLGSKPYFEGKFMYNIASELIDITKMIEFIENEYLSNDCIIEINCDPHNNYGYWQVEFYLAYGENSVKEMQYNHMELVDALWELILDNTRFFSWNEL